MDFDRFLSDENVALYRLLASPIDAAQRRTILAQLAEETAKLKCELRQSGSGPLATPVRRGACGPQRLRGRP